MMPSGHFTTNVASIDANGHAYAPGQNNVSSLLRRAKMADRDDPDDPSDPFIDTPIGDTPYVFFALLIAGYVVYRRRFARDTND